MTFGTSLYGECAADDCESGLSSLSRNWAPAPTPTKASVAVRAIEGRPVQRVIDVLGAAALLLIALPFLVMLAVLLQLDSPGRLFFVQRRIGRGGVTFPCLKFRTMCDNADTVLAAHLAASTEARNEWSRDFKLRDDPRVTTLGRFVRKLSLDEFPQLLNILAGHMSLVGPRPIIEAEILRYGRFFGDYCSVRPGLTGLWQINGRNETSYRRRVSLDRYYARNRSVAMDLAILFQTVPAVLIGKGAY